MRINVAVPEAHVRAPVLNSALEAVTRLNESMIKSGELRPFNMRHPGVRWRPEPPGQGEHFDHGRLVSGRKWGDCDDLAPWLAATRRLQGDRGAHAFVKKSGPNRWHALVRRGNGHVEDPSLAAGMPGPGARHGVHGAVQPFMLLGSSVVGGVGSYLARPQLAIRPTIEPGGEIESWQARTDLPWHSGPGTSPTDIAMVSLHRTPTPDQSLVGALEGAIALGAASGRADPEHINRLCCLSDMVQGCSWEEAAREYGPEHATAAGAIVGKLFRHFGRKLKKFGRGLGKVLKTGVKFAAPMAAPLLKKAGLPPQAAQAISPALQSLLDKEKHLPPSQRGRGGGGGNVTVNVFTQGAPKRRQQAWPGAAAVSR